VIAVEDADLPLGAQRRDGERHGDAVIVKGADRTPADVAAVDDDAVVEHLVAHAQGRQALGHARDAVALLHAQLLGTAQYRAPSAQAAATNSTGNSSIASGTSSAGNLDAAQGRVAHEEVRDRLAADLALVAPQQRYRRP
jgi:hypothetical protein